MDHLPYPNNATLPPLRVPYLCGDVESYDGLGLEEFPRRKGWTTNIPPSQWSTRDTARMQSWLFFGLLEELAGQSFERHHFLDVSTDGQQYVTTRKLPALLKDRCQENSRLYLRMASLGFRDMSQRGFLRGRPHVRLNERVTISLRLAEEQSDILDAETPSARTITLSIKILIWSIRNALTTYLPSREENSNLTLRQSRLLRLRMLDGGKCPYWTEVYLQTYSAAMIYYLAATPSVGGNVNHRRCSAEQCIAHDVDMQRYTTKHVKDECQCNMVAPDIEKIATIIENGGVPLISLKELSTGILALDVVQAKYGLHYTAISHVWSGGLGNPSSNALPECRLRDIRRGTFFSGAFGQFLYR